MQNQQWKYCCSKKVELGIYLPFGNRVGQWRYTQTLACCICICCLLECWVAWCWRGRLISPFNCKTIAIRNRISHSLWLCLSKCISEKIKKKSISFLNSYKNMKDLFLWQAFSEIAKVENYRVIHFRDGTRFWSSSTPATCNFAIKRLCHGFFQV